MRLLSREVTFEEFRNEWLKEIDGVLEVRGGWPLVGRAKEKRGTES